MARPKKEEKEKYKHRFTLWFNDDQKNIFKKIGLTSGDKIRDFVLETYNKKTIIITSDKDPKYINELNKMGVNLNQIAKKYNSLGELSNLDIEKINNIVEILAAKINESDALK